MNQIRIYCNVCNVPTLHEMCSTHNQNYYDDFWRSSRLIVGEILKCNGCESLSFRLIEHPLEFEKEGKIVEHIFPKRSHLLRKKKYYFSLPKNINKIYKQVIIAFDDELYILSAMGLRALLEAIITNKFTDSVKLQTIKDKINLLSKHFNKVVIDTLHDFRFMGNDAIHELKEPDRLDIHRALNVLEDILTFYYGVDYSASSYKELKSKKEDG